MSLLCELGWHRPGGVPRWNDGYYFAKCTRCEADLVRTAFGDWHVPAGYKVVWQSKPPADRPEVALVQEEAAAPEMVDEAIEPAEVEAETDEPASAETKLPVEELLDKLNEEPAPEAVEPEPVVSAPAPAPAPRFYRDFMDDDHDDGRRAAVAMHGERASPAGGAQAAQGSDEGEGDDTPGFLESVWPAAARGNSDSAAPRGLLLFSGSALVVALAIAALIYGPVPRPSGPAPDTPPLEAAPLPAGAGTDPFAAEGAATDAYYVTASVLSCRSAPAAQARRVRNLARGAQVDVLASEGDWVSLSYRGRQCWALGRYIAPAEPL